MRVGLVMLAVSTGASALAVQMRHRAHRLLDVASGSQGHVLYGAVLGRYLDEGGPTGALGLPVSREHQAIPGPSTPIGALREADFQFGTIYLDGGTRHTKVVLHEGGAERGRQDDRLAG